MRRNITSLILCVAAVLASHSGAYALQGANKPAGQKQSQSVLGVWRGESKCLVVPSGCRDEQALYRITAGPSETKVRLSGNKIVDGKEINMGGDGECAFEPATSVLDCRLPGGSSLHLQAKGNSMEGKMTRGDGTPWRKISLQKDQQK